MTDERAHLPHFRLQEFIEANEGRLGELVDLAISVIDPHADERDICREQLWFAVLCVQFLKDQERPTAATLKDDMARLAKALMKVEGIASALPLDEAQIVFEGADGYLGPGLGRGEFLRLAARVRRGAEFAAASIEAGKAGQHLDYVLVEAAKQARRLLLQLGQSKISLAPQGAFVTLTNYLAHMAGYPEDVSVVRACRAAHEWAEAD